MAEGKGFEPATVSPATVFKTACFHSPPLLKLNAVTYGPLNGTSDSGLRLTAKMVAVGGFEPPSSVKSAGL